MPTTTLRKSYGRILTTKTKDLGHGIVEVIVSTNSKDRHGEILDIKGLNTKNYSGVVFVNHDYETLPVGKSLGLKKTADGKLLSKTQFAVDEYDAAATVYKLVKGGYMPDVSIGFIPKEFDADTNTWTKSEMIEYSHVGIGANPEAKVIKGLDKIGMDMDEFKHQLADYQKAIKKDLDFVGEPKDTPVDEVTGDTFTAPELPDTPEPTPDIDLPPEKEAEKLDAEPGVIITEGLDVDKVTNDNDNVLKHLDAIGSLVSAAKDELQAQPLNDTDNSAEAQVKRKRYILVRAKKQAQAIDSLAELTIMAIKRKLNNEE